MGSVTSQERLIACPAPDGERWCVRSQRMSYDAYGGAEDWHPFSYRALIRDAFDQYKDYTLTKSEAISQLLELDNLHPSDEISSLSETHVVRESMKHALALGLY